MFFHVWWWHVRKRDMIMNDNEVFSWQLQETLPKSKSHKPTAAAVLSWCRCLQMLPVHFQLPQVCSALGDYLSFKLHTCLGGKSVKEGIKAIKSGRNQTSRLPVVSSFRWTNGFSPTAAGKKTEVSTSFLARLVEFASQCGRFSRLCGTFDGLVDLKRTQNMLGIIGHPYCSSKRDETWGPEHDPPTADACSLTAS